MSGYLPPFRPIQNAALALLFMPALVFAQQQASGVVTGVQGQAQLTRPAIAPAALRVRDGVVIRDVIDTREKSLARILFGGKATVTVKELSRFEVREENIPGGGTRSTIELNSGAVLVNVARQLMGPGDEVHIRTPNAVAAVRGSAVYAEATDIFSQITGSSVLNCIAPLVCPIIDLAENFTSRFVGSGFSPPEPLPPGAASQIVNSMQTGKSITSEGNAAQIVAGAFGEVNALQTAATALIGSQPTAGSPQPSSNPPPQAPQIRPGGDPAVTGNPTATSTPPPISTPPVTPPPPVVVGAGIGSYLAANSGGRELFGLNSNGGSGSSSYIAGAKADLIAFGHTLIAPTASLTSSYFGTVSSFYMGLLNSTPTAAEQTALGNWVTSGGRLFIQQDHTGGPWFGPANTLLGNFGFGAANTSTSDNHLIVSGHSITTSPNALRGQTFTGAANSKFDPSAMPTNATIFARGGSANGPITGAFAPFGLGIVATTTDIDMWSSAGGYGTDPNNRKLWQNLWAFLDGSASIPESAPLFSVTNGQKFVGQSNAALLDASNLSLLSDSVLFSSGPGSSVSLSGPVVNAKGGNLTIPYSVLGVHNGSKLVSSSKDPLVWLQGGNYSISTLAGESIFHMSGTETAIGPQTGVAVGSAPSVTHDGALLQAIDGATINTQKVLKLDTALLEATLPVINLIGSANAHTSLTTETSAIDLIRSKVVSMGPVIALDKGLINVNNGPLINVTSGGQLITAGHLLSLINGSRINVFNGPLMSVSGAGSLLNAGALVSFGGTGGNRIVVNNSITPTATLSGLPVSATSGASIAIGRNPVINPHLGNISVTGSLIQATNGGRVSINAN